MPLDMLDDRVAIIPIEDPSITPGGLYIPDTGKQKADQGIIKYRGKNVKELKAGDHVLFSPYDGDKVTLHGEGVLHIMPEKQVKALIRSEVSATIISIPDAQRIVRETIAKELTNFRLLDADEDFSTMEYAVLQFTKRLQVELLANFDHHIYDWGFEF